MKPQKWRVFRFPQYVKYPMGKLRINHWIALPASNGHYGHNGYNGYMFKTWREAFDYAYSMSSTSPVAKED